MIIAIDGPSGSGKSTLGRMLARELKLLYIDTGSMYRAIAFAVIAAKIDPVDWDAVSHLTEQLDINLLGDPDSIRVLLNGTDITQLIRGEDVTYLSSVVSTIPRVRQLMVELQRRISKGGAILNGRDIGTVVFPHADVKFFLTASAEKRAERRFNEKRVESSAVSYKQTLDEINERDYRDSTRNHSPLLPATDAIVIDATKLTVTEVFERMMSAIRAKTRNRS